MSPCLGSISSLVSKRLSLVEHLRASQQGQLWVGFRSGARAWPLAPLGSAGAEPGSGLCERLESVPLWQRSRAVLRPCPQGGRAAHGAGALSQLPPSTEGGLRLPYPHVVEAALGRSSPWSCSGLWEPLLGACLLSTTPLTCVCLGRGLEPMKAPSRPPVHQLQPPWWSVPCMVQFLSPWVGVMTVGLIGMCGKCQEERSFREGP